MNRFFKIVFLTVFVLNLIPKGGALVRYPTLDKILEKIDKDYPDLAKEIRGHSLPSSMCGVARIVDYNSDNFFDFLLFFSNLSSVRYLIHHFSFDVKVEYEPLPNKNAQKFLPIPKAIFLPPPRPLI